MSKTYKDGPIPRNSTIIQLNNEAALTAFASLFSWLWQESCLASLSMHGPTEISKDSETVMTPTEKVAA